MTPAVKRFLVGYTLLYFMVAIALNVTLGPPGMSRGYLDTYKVEHDRYLETTKSDAYKLWQENAELNPPDEAMLERIAFVSEYEGRGEFQSEQRRRSIYGGLFDVFNALMLIVLAGRFGAKPLLGLLDSMIAQVRSTIESTEHAENEAAERLGRAETGLAGLEGERAQLEAETNDRLSLELEEIVAQSEKSAALLQTETEDRKHHEELLARRALKEALVEESMKVLVERYNATRSPEQESALIDQFVDQLGKMR